MSEPALGGEALLLTLEESAIKCRVSRATMCRLVATGDIASVKIGRSRRVPVGALEKFVDRLTQDQASVRALVSRTCAEQGLPEQVDDEATLARVAYVVGHGERRAK